MKISNGLVVAALAAAVAVGPVALAQTKGAWVHVRVEEPGRQSKVAVNLPLSVVHAALAMAPEKFVSDGRVRLHAGDSDLSVTDLRRLWNELKTTGDAELISVEDKDETVHVTRAGDRLKIVASKPSEKESVNVEVPVALVDALLSAEGREVNVKAALAELQKIKGDIVRVQDRNSSVHVWIDEKE